MGGTGVGLGSGVLLGSMVAVAVGEAGVSVIAVTTVVAGVLLHPLSIKAQLKIITTSTAILGFIA